MVRQGFLVHLHERRGIEQEVETLEREVRGQCHDRKRAIPKPDAALPPRRGHHQKQHERRDTRDPDRRTETRRPSEQQRIASPRSSRRDRRVALPPRGKAIEDHEDARGRHDLTVHRIEPQRANAERTGAPQDGPETGEQHTVGEQRQDTEQQPDVHQVGDQHGPIERLRIEAEQPPRTEEGEVTQVQIVSAKGGQHEVQPLATRDVREMQEVIREEEHPRDRKEDQKAQRERQ